MKTRDLKLLYFVPLLLLAMAIALATPSGSRAAPVADGRKLETAVFAGGCFWGVEGVFEHVRGVVDAQSGYAGGQKDYAHYEDVGTGTTGHAESVQVTYDPAQVSYGQLLSVFFTVAHDPTQLNRQGPDTGTQYRSAIFYRTGSQHLAALEYVRQLESSGRLGKPVVTQIVSLDKFYPAEPYHQDFMRLNPMHPYILVNDRPKVQHLREAFPKLYVEDGLAKR